MPFFSVSNDVIVNVFNGDKRLWDDILDVLFVIMSVSYMEMSHLRLLTAHVTPEHFNHTYSRSSRNTELSVFHAKCIPR